MMSVIAGDLKIAFDSELSGNREVYIMNADGSGLTQLTFGINPDYNEQPTLSPDGTKILFQSHRDGDWEIYVMNSDGTGQTRLTNIAGDDGAPAWSPDGTKVVFYSDRDGSGREIYVMDADGTDPVRLTTNSYADSDPAWSPDGTKIAFDSSRGGNQDIFVVDADGTNERQLTSSPEIEIRPAWSPDGTKIAFCGFRNGNQDIVIINADGSGSETILTTYTGDDRDPAWSPDGSQIVFASHRAGLQEIFVTDADEDNAIQLTFTGSVRNSHPTIAEYAPCVNDLGAVSGCGNIELTWSPVNAAAYHVYRSTISGGPYIFLGDVQVASYLDTNVIVGTTYWYVVRPADGNGMEYCQSNEASETPDSCVPEFPAFVIPLGLIVGLISIVVVIRKKF
jgi:Tol biopolymer transport system component